jgi:hypothetical protein
VTGLGEERPEEEPPRRGRPPVVLAHPGQGILDDVLAACNPGTCVRILAHSLSADQIVQQASTCD